MPAVSPQEPVAIIGMACIFPEAPDLQAFWNNILGCVDAVGEPVPNWDARRYLDSGRIKTSMGGWLKDLYRFDPREFGIMPNSMDGGEPDHFLALRVARDALADAGCLGPEFDHRDTGIILGHSTYLHRGQVTVIQNNIVLDQTMDLLRAALPHLDAEGEAELRRRLQAKLPPTNSDTAPGLVPNVMTGRIANRLNLRGPNYLVDAACSSSLLAVGAAMDELRAGRSRIMLAGGVNASLPADVSTIFTQLGALSARGKVRPFETGGDGTLLGEGLGMVVLKRLSDALSDNDRVYAVLRGIGQASDGRGTGLLAPSVDGETLAIRRAYDATGIDPASVSLIEAHGTGIPLGDKTEVAALKNVFGVRAAGAQGSIALGSVKSMISHCIPAAGIAGLIKTSLALHHRVLPPTLCDSVNPELGIASTRLFVNTEAMPWIAPLGQPRRAGVDSFGFGGINTHAIVEQAPESARRHGLLARWPFELLVLSAETQSDLAAHVDTLCAAIERNPGWQLDEIAAALAAASRAGSARLAIVASSRDALTKALKGAVSKLRSRHADAWSTRNGAHFCGASLEGKLAFLFPGEGSQYQGMFADLAQCFDEVRHWLDFWRGLYPDEPGQSRTDIAFPAATELTPERKRLLEARLHDMDVGSEAVMVGGQAMFALLKSLGVHPDVMLGHSSGESSALAASRALPADDLTLLAAFVREMNGVYQRVLGEGKIPTGRLLAVGALPSSMVRDTLAGSPARIEVAMDNCANQLVLYGGHADIEDIQARLVALGGICMPLPFDRGYHTPDFAQVSEAFLGYYKSIKLGVPKLPLYSCASTRPFPASAGAARKLAAAQWSTTVRFRETVHNMVADGVQLFLEVGPSGNLSAFVDDILADQPHLAIATNLRRKHGLEQFLTALAQLWVRGRPVDLSRLYDRRRVAVIDLATDQKLVQRPGLLDNTMPTLRLNDEDRHLLSRLGSATATSSPSTELVPPPPASAGVALPHPASASASESATVMSEYFGVMSDFLVQQQAVLARWQPPADGCVPPADPDASEVAWTFIEEVLSQSTTQLQARCRLSVHQHAFLRDHVLSGVGSDTDPNLLGLACVPLMVSLEIMAQACTALAGRTDLKVIENVRAFDWIALDDGELELEVQIEALAGRPGHFRATLHQFGAMAVSADLGFVPAWQLGPLGAISDVSAARWDGAEIYDVGMFHGPIFQSLQHITGWSAQGIDCDLTDCRLEGFFEPGQWPVMVLNPVLLDAMGQLAACWVAEHVGTDFNCFPSTIERIELYRPLPAPQPGISLQGRQTQVGGTQQDDIRAARSWSFEAADAEGDVLVRVAGLVNVFFDVPHRFYLARRDPLNGWLGAPLQRTRHSLPWLLEQLPEAFCAQSNGIFLRILAMATLNIEERQAWLQLPPQPRLRREWLLGRLALKELVRYWLYHCTGQLIYPSDVTVYHDQNGKPSVGGWWVDHLAPAPAVSLAHDGAVNIAVLGADGYPVGVDVEAKNRLRRPDALAMAFTPSEEEWLRSCTSMVQEEAALWLWCAKEAAAKWTGLGLRGSPELVEVGISPTDGSSAMVHVHGTIVAVTYLHMVDFVIAIAEGPERAEVFS